VEQAPNNMARILLWEKMYGWDHYCTEEPYTVIRDRLLKAQQSTSRSVEALS
jgi:hypothetical protein